MNNTSKPRPVPSSAPAFRPDLAFAQLTPDMLERLKSYGTEERLAANTSLWSRGQRHVDMFVVLDGTIEVYGQDEDGQRQVIATLHEGQFTGELDLLNSRPSLVDGCTAEETRLLRVPRLELQRLMRSEADIANLIMQATIWRRIGLLERSEIGIILVGHCTAAETLQLQRFLVRNTYPYRLLEPAPEQPAGADGNGSSAIHYRLPAIIFPDGHVLESPSIAQLADELGINESASAESTFDLAVVGAGPSGLAAAVYGASEGLSTIVIEGIAPGGQAGTSSKIENYLGFPTGVSGQELANRAQVQAQKFGARLAISRDVVRIDSTEGMHTLLLADSATIHARAVVIATGAQYRKLNLENFAHFENQGIQYAATAMEANLCRDQEVAVIGGGNSAGQAAAFLSAIAKRVHLIIRGASLADSMSSYLLSRIEGSPRITLHTHTDVTQLDGDTALRSVTWTNRQTGERTTRPVTSLFVMIGAEPNTGWLYGTIALDRKGFIITGTDKAFENTRYATSVPGIYAVGDVRSDSVKRIASAVGEGSIVIADIHRYLVAHPAICAEANSTLAAMQAVAAPAGQQPSAA